MVYDVIDDVLNKNDFNDISNIIMDNEDFLWSYCGDVEGKEFKDSSTANLFYMTHQLYYVMYQSLKDNVLDHVPVKDHYYDALEPLTSILTQQGLKWWRIKCNLYPATETLREHAFHIDNKSSHVAAIFSLNSCDGYTRFEDGTKVDSVANRLFFFDGGIPHSSTTTTNVPARFNINFNFYHTESEKS